MTSNSEGSANSVALIGTTTSTTSDATVICWLPSLHAPVTSSAPYVTVFCAGTSLGFIGWRLAYETKSYGLQFVCMLSERFMCGTYVALTSQPDCVAVRLSLLLAAMHRVVNACSCIQCKQ